jgi:hypothetical protein
MPYSDVGSAIQLIKMMACGIKILLRRGGICGENVAKKVVAWDK